MLISCRPISAPANHSSACLTAMEVSFAFTFIDGIIGQEVAKFTKAHYQDILKS